MTFPEAIVVGLIQGVTELFPMSSLGHNVLIPALVGGRWAQDLNVSTPESPYLAYIVGLHVATAAAMILYFWRDWVRIIGAFFRSLADLRRGGVQSLDTDERLAWMIVLATIPVGISGLALEHTFRVTFAKPLVTAAMLFVNGLILLAGERVRIRGHEESQRLEQEDKVAVASGVGASAAAHAGAGRHSSGQRAVKQVEASLAVQSDRRIVSFGYLNGVILGATQILALMPGISRDGIVMVSGMARGMTRQDAARFSFLLSAPVILAAGVLKIPDLYSNLGAGIHGQVYAGAAVSFVGAYLALRYFMRYISKSSRTLTPFAVYCLLAGLGSYIYLVIR